MLTTVLELLGLLLIVAALAILVATWTIPGALAVAGVGVIVVAWLIERSGRRRSR